MRQNLWAHLQAPEFNSKNVSSRGSGHPCKVCPWELSHFKGSVHYFVILLCLLAAGIESLFGPFWALPNEFLTGYSAAAGIALINSVGSLGGFAGPYMIGAIAMRTGSLYAGLAIAGVAMFMSAILVLLLPKRAGTIGTIHDEQAEI